MSMQSKKSIVDGFYAGYFSAVSGNAIALLVMRDGIIVGTDGSANYDGRYTMSSDGSADVSINVMVKPNNLSIQGKSSGKDGFKYSIELRLAEDFATLPFLSIKTEFGPVNARFEKLRGIESNND